jgi:hypothetical protein
MKVRTSLGMHAHRSMPDRFRAHIRDTPKRTPQTLGRLSRLGLDPSSDAIVTTPSTHPTRLRAAGVRVKHLATVTAGHDCTFVCATPRADQPAEVGAEDALRVASNEKSACTAHKPGRDVLPLSPARPSQDAANPPEVLLDVDPRQTDGQLGEPEAAVLPRELDVAAELPVGYEPESPGPGPRGAGVGDEFGVEVADG